MRSKDLKIGQRVAVLTTKEVESYTRVQQYEVLDTRPWARSGRYGAWGRQDVPKTPAGITLPEGVNWTSAIRNSPETAWSSKYGSAPGALAVQVLHDGTYADRPTILPLTQIKGEYAPVYADVVRQQDAMLKRSQDERAARKRIADRYNAAVQDAVDAGLLASTYSATQRGSHVTISLEDFERLISDALTLRNREQG